MSAPAIPARRPVTAVRPPQTPQPHVKWQGLFQEAVYADGQPYAETADEGDEGDD